MSSKRHLRGQGVALTPAELAIERARVRVAGELLGAGVMPSQSGVDVLWSPEETAALAATLAGQAVRIRRTNDRAS